jgi:hypothetical protein
MLILVEGNPATDTTDDGRFAVLQAARLLGHRVHAIPREGQLAPGQPPIPGLERGDFQWGVVFGDAPSVERYRAIHDQARALNVTLLNDVGQHQQAHELARTVGSLEGLTARSQVVSSVDEVDAALTRLAAPVFVRGSTGSAKDKGWNACLAQDAAQTKALVAQVLSQPERSRGQALLREVLPLRRIEKRTERFPLAREYRLFVLDADVLAIGAYWAEQDPFGALTDRDEQEIRTLAHETARRVKVPWLAVDVGQLETGEWKVIETGDPWCAGLGSVNPRALVAALASGLEQRAGC